jgi:hypothetical protein
MCLCMYLYVCVHIYNCTHTFNHARILPVQHTYIRTVRLHSVYIYTYMYMYIRICTHTWQERLVEEAQECVHQRKAGWHWKSVLLREWVYVYVSMYVYMYVCILCIRGRQGGIREVYAWESWVYVCLCLFMCVCVLYTLIFTIIVFFFKAEKKNSTFDLVF